MRKEKEAWYNTSFELFTKRVGANEEDCNANSRSVFDPRPIEFFTIDNDTLAHFRCDLLSFGEPSVFLGILLPSAKKIKHDHTYSLSPQSENKIDYVPIEKSSASEDQELLAVKK